MQALEKNGAKAEQLEEISAEASRALNEVREISYDLRPYQLDRLGLTKAIEAVVATAASASQTEFAADIDDIDDLFPEESRINLYRIVQESLNNILKHAAATHARVTVKRKPRESAWLSETTARVLQCRKQPGIRNRVERFRTDGHCGAGAVAGRPKHRLIGPGQRH